MPHTDRWGFSRILLALGFCLVPWLQVAPCMPSASAQNWAEKMFQETSHDFRIVGRGTKSEHHFEFTNKYQQEVHVASVRSSCGCTTPSITKDTLKTHDKSSILASFNTSSFIGQRSATITVVFDRPTYAEVVLKVTGFIRTDITFDPPEVNFGEFSAGQTREQDVTITHSGSNTWEITDVRSHCQHLQVRLEPAERTPGQVRYRMRVQMNETMPEGEIRERLTLISNDREFPTTEMLVSGRVRPTVSISPASISLGQTGAGETKEQRLVVRGEEAFEILDVQCADKRFEFEVPGGEKNLHFVKLRFRGDGSQDPISQEVRVVTSLPGDKSATCIVTGSIKP
jgi:hypothetical protein